MEDVNIWHTDWLYYVDEYKGFRLPIWLTDYVKVKYIFNISYEW